MANENSKQTRRGGVLGSTAGIRPDVRYVGRAGGPRKLRFAVTFTIVSALILAFVFGWRPKQARLYNPGHVTRVHASIEFECAKCHDGYGRGGFVKTVSDKACMACHDGSIHHPNQVVAAAGSDPRSAAVRSALAIADANHVGGMRSASCVSCHIEHRGREALLATDDSTCTRCHDNLKLHSTKPGQIPQGNVRVVAFSLNDHPAFGHSLMPANLPAANAAGGETLAALMGVAPSRPTDPTPLRFNHYLHLEKYPWMRANNCTSCHSAESPQLSTTQPSPSGVDLDSTNFVRPPWVDEKDAAFVPFLGAARTKAGMVSSTLPLVRKPLSLAGSGSRKFMQPVSYDRSCITCHSQKLNPDQSLMDLRTLNKSLALDGTPPDSKTIILPHKSLNELRGMIAGYLGMSLAGGKIPDDNKPLDWVRMTASSLSDDLGKKAKLPKNKKSGVTQVAVAAKAAHVTTENLVDLYTADLAVSSCTKCHEVQGTLPHVDGDGDDMTYTPGAYQLTPTGIGPGPRRWYPNSSFDHGAHRDMSCVECHAKLGGIADFASVALSEEDKHPKDPDHPPTSESDRLKNAAGQVDDTELLVPSAAWSVYTFTPVPGSDPRTVTVTSRQRSCAECHHPETVDSRGAGTTCIVCHNFHDRTREEPTTRPSHDPMARPSDEPVASAADKPPGG